MKLDQEHRNPQWPKSDTPGLVDSCQTDQTQHSRNFVDLLHKQALLDRISSSYLIGT